MQKISISKIGKLDYRTNEAFKRLRTNILFSGSDVKCIAITSCLPGDGKSTVSMNLAKSFAEMGKKTIFIDSDLRKSVLMGRYKISKSIGGLSHYLSGMYPLEEVVCTTNVENLDMILSGPVPPNPAELLGGKLLKEMITRLKKVYDYIIIDTPPLGNVVDSAIISSQCDGTALVMASGVISARFAEEMVEQIKNTGTKFLGIILNKVSMSGNGYYGKYYGKYYGRYGHGGDSTDSQKG